MECLLLLLWYCACRCSSDRVSAAAVVRVLATAVMVFAAAVVRDLAAAVVVPAAAVAESLLLLRWSPCCCCDRVLAAAVVVECLPLLWQESLLLL